MPNSEFAYRVIVTLGIALTVPIPALADDSTSSPNRIDFVRDVEPIFSARCYSCHGPDEQEGQLRLDARSIVRRGGISGPLFESGKGKESLLYKFLAGVGDVERMPLDDEPLSGEEVAIIVRWIDEGAVWPDGVGAEVELESHWAYVPPAASTVPEVSQPGWVRTPIDAFVLHQLDARKLHPSERAEDARLLRRVYLDLIGLPPSVEEVDDFVESKRVDKYEQVVDRLLASPQYGPRWARPWLDAARYADSNGYQADQYREVWPYRDWVINAMNADMPFDQFTLEQLAGDLLPEPTIAQRIATGFSRLTTCNVEAGVDPEENRVNQIIDRVNTTGTVWLGSSIECAQCHNHKYDPFTQRDYYQLFAYFNNTPLEVDGNGVTYEFVGPKMDLPLSETQCDEREQLETQIAALREQLKPLVAERLKMLGEWEQQQAAAQQDTAQWHVLDIASFESSGGASHTLLDDKSILIGGTLPDSDIYTIVVDTTVHDITGFKLETLTDSSLPDTGPGRYTRPNFILHEFTVAAESHGGGSGSQTIVKLHSPSADFSQKGWDVAGAIDGDAKTGWAINPEFGKPHEARFLTEKPIAFEGSATLTFTLDQHYGGGRTIGRMRLSAMTGAPNKSDLPETIATILKRPSDKRNAKQRQELDEYFTELDPSIKRLRVQVAELQKKVDAIKPTTTLVMIEQAEPRKTTVFKRGSFLDQGEPVTMSTPEALPELADVESQDRRDLAMWLASRENPLTARVAVNRWWAEIFGQGIVATLEDFGTQGERPTHPELLDWLAMELMNSGWSMKHVHRQIVLSATYQQSSRLTPELQKLDPYNKLYARAPRFRLPAETVRDNALAIAGLLSYKMAGPPIFPPQPPNIWRHVGRNEPKYDTSTGNDRFRRGIYVIWRRSAPYPSFINFDAPDRASCVVNRPRTNTPLQALTLMNDPAYVEMAIALAERIANTQDLKSVEDRVAFAVKLCAARTATSEELRHLAEVFRRERERFELSPDEARSLLGARADSLGDAREVAAWFFIANILLNLDETITKS
ncbi:MAG: PSD1 domain-containing protein [Planctomycetaceae bacterium]|nr:PSD1 domain-containing protein [Planctomycetales bacterium]MCB9926369.1 PSD1 domain-containing protein [Planctomycetaceae bacterium]